MNYLIKNQMIREQHPKLCSYWSKTKLIYFPLSISQVTAVEAHVEKLIEENFDFCRDNDLPNNDRTNSCSYLSLGVIDHFITGTYKKFEERKFVSDIQSITEEFPKKFNPFRNVKSMPYVYDTYNLLSNNNLLKNQFEFIECFVDNYTILRIYNIAKTLL